MDTSPPTRPPTSLRARALRAGAAILLIAAVPVAVAGLLGQDDDPSAPSTELDYAVRPLDIPAGQMTAIGVVALLRAAAAVAVLLHGSRGRGPDRRRWPAEPRRWQVVCPLVGVGVVLGYGYHVATAGVIGANIGYGLVVLFGGPVVVVLLVVAAARAWALRAEARRRIS
jgi:hypothetical protein